MIRLVLVREEVIAMHFYELGHIFGHQVHFKDENGEDVGVVTSLVDRNLGRRVESGHFEQLVGGIESFDRLAEVVGSQDRKEGCLHAVSDVLDLALNQLLLLLLDVGFLLAVVCDHEFVQILGKLLLDRSGNGLKSIGQEVVARLNVLIARLLHSFAERVPALFDVNLSHVGVLSPVSRCRALRE